MEFRRRSRTMAEVGIWSELGTRNAQQDRHAHAVVPLTSSVLARVAAIFDGHGNDSHGHIVSDMLAANFIPTLTSTQPWQLLITHLETSSDWEIKNNVQTTHGESSFNNTDNTNDTPLLASSVASFTSPQPHQDRENKPNLQQQAENSQPSTRTAATPTRSSVSSADLVSHLIQQALREAVAIVEQTAAQVIHQNRSFAGSTLCAVVVLAEAQPHGRVLALYTANVGDSRALLACGPWGQAIPLNSRPLTSDHVPNRSDERDRIQRAGGWIKEGKLLGYIAMSRAIGDTELKEHRNTPGRFPLPPPDFTPPTFADGQRFTDQLFIATPEIDHHPITEHMHFCVVASDGLWNELSNDQVVYKIYSDLKKGRTLSSAAKRLVRYYRHHRDNITVIIIPLSLDAIQSGEHSQNPSSESLITLEDTSQGTSSGDPSFHGGIDSRIAAGSVGETATALAEALESSDVTAEDDEADYGLSNSTAMSSKSPRTLDGRADADPRADYGPSFTEAVRDRSVPQPQVVPPADSYISRSRSYPTLDDPGVESSSLKAQSPNDTRTRNRKSPCFRLFSKDRGPRKE